MNSVTRSPKVWHQVVWVPLGRVLFPVAGLHRSASGRLLLHRLLPLFFPLHISIFGDRLLKTKANAKPGFSARDNLSPGQRRA